MQHCLLEESWSGRTAFNTSLLQCKHGPIWQITTLHKIIFLTSLNCPSCFRLSVTVLTCFVCPCSLHVQVPNLTFALYSPLSLQVFIPCFSVPCCRQRYFLFPSLFSFPQKKINCSGKVFFVSEL